VKPIAVAIVRKVIVLANARLIVSSLGAHAAHQAIDHYRPLRARSKFG
jgi:hypothetical protein